MNEMKRTDWIDMARGYGILLVMIAHLCEWTSVGSLIYSFHLPLFFLLSGYLFSIRESFAAFVKRKVTGMLVPYFCLAIPMIFWDIFAEKGGLSWMYAPMFQGTRLVSIDSYGGTFDWSRMGAQQPISVLCRDALGLLVQKRMWTFWFLACLFVLSFLFYFLVRFLKKEWIRAVVVCAIAAVGFVYYALGQGALPWNADAALTALPFFYVGWLLKRYGLLDKWLFKDKSYRIRKWGVLLFTLAFLCNGLFCFLNWVVAGQGLEMYFSQYGFLPFMFLSAFAGIFATIVLSGIYPIRPIKYIGKYSLVYFLLHQGICYPLMERIFFRLHIFQADTGVTFWFRVLVEVACSVGLLTLFNFILSKTPLKFVLGK